MSEKLENAELVDKVLEQENICLGSDVRILINYEKLAHILGYKRTTGQSAFEAFLEDNPGLGEAIQNWITSNLTKEWREEFESYLPEDEEDE